MNVLILIMFLAPTALSSEYSQYCNESTPLSTPLQEFSPPELKLIKPAGNNTITIEFYTNYAFQTQTINLFKLLGKLEIATTVPGTYGFRYSENIGLLRTMVLVSGFWDPVSGKLCMTGSASQSSSGNTVRAIIKLHYTATPDIYSSLLNGTLDTFDQDRMTAHSYHINILDINKRNYSYRLIEKEENAFRRFDYLANVSLPSKSTVVGMFGLPRYIDLEYKDDCHKTNCHFFGGVDTGKRPNQIFTKMIGNPFRRVETDKFRFLLVARTFKRAYGIPLPLEANSTIVVEGKWNEEKKRLDMAGCRIIGDEEGNRSIGDCSVRLSLRRPSKWTLRETNEVVGEMWSTKRVNESGYFEQVHLRRNSNNNPRDDKLTYEYTKIESVRNICAGNINVTRKGLSYPGAPSSDMGFSMSVTDEKGKTYSGLSSLLTVGDQFYQPGGKPTASSTMVNVTFDLTFGSFDRIIRSTQIAAEGLYYPRTGQLCMIGCKHDTSTDRELGNNNSSVDCDVIINVQYPPLNETRITGIKGTIQSIRSESDPLYFKPLQISSHSVYQGQARRAIWRMDFEIAMVLISNTLICVFVGLQLLYVSKSPGVLPNISVIMLILLSLCHIAPLLLNFEALFFRNRNRQNIYLGTGWWIEANEVFVRVITMIAFLLEFRLLQLTWSSRNEEPQKKSLWLSDKKVLWLLLPLYFGGGLIVWFLAHVSGNSHQRRPHPRLHDIPYKQQSLWGGLKLYGGLTLDGFLLPQILFNIFSNARVEALSPLFYMGTTVVRLLPHAYDLYRDHDPT